MNLEEFYAQIGGDYADTLQRLCNENMVKKFVKSIRTTRPAPTCTTRLCSRTGKLLFRGAHTLKGVAQNLGFERLYQVSAVLDRGHEREKPLEDRSLLDAVEQQDAAIRRAISSLRSKGRTVWVRPFETVEKTSFSEQSRLKPRFRGETEEKPRPTGTFFLPCINSEIYAPGIYEFASANSILCCRTKRKNYNNTF